MAGKKINGGTEIRSKKVAKVVLVLETLESIVAWWSEDRKPIRIIYDYTENKTIYITPSLKNQYKDTKFLVLQYFFPRKPEIYIETLNKQKLERDLKEVINDIDWALYLRRKIHTLLIKRLSEKGIKLEDVRNINIRKVEGLVWGEGFTRELRTKEGELIRNVPITTELFKGKIYIEAELVGDEKEIEKAIEILKEGITGKVGGMRDLGFGLVKLYIP